MLKRYFVCRFCGSRVEVASEEPPCKALNGWFMVTHWRGMESVDHYGFCSYVCLKAWVDTEIFLKSIEEKKK